MRPGMQPCMRAGVGAGFAGTEQAVLTARDAAHAVAARDTAHAVVLLPGLCL